MIKVGVRGFLIQGRGKQDRPVPWFWTEKTKLGVRRGSLISELGLEKVLNSKLTDTFRGKTVEQLIYDQVVPFFYHDVDLEYRQYKDYIESGQSFMVMVPLECTPIDCSVEDLYLPEDLLLYLQKKKATVEFFIPTEGDIYRDEDFKWFEDFSVRFGLDKETCILHTANLWDGYESQNYTIVKDNYFEHFPWFLTKNFKEPSQLSQEEFLQNRHMICLNRVPRYYRFPFVAYLGKNYLDKSYISLGNNHNLGLKDILQFYGPFSDIYSLLRDYYVRDRAGVFTHVLDDEDSTMQTNHAFDISCFQRKAAVALVVETLYDTKHCIFFSEKTFKPIFCKQPFILASMEGSLQKLRDLGYRTFGDYWDESYDLEPDPTERMRKIFHTIDQVMSKSMSELYEMYLDMQPILEHNYRLFISRIRFLLDEKDLKGMKVESDKKVKNIHNGMIKFGTNRGSAWFPNKQIVYGQNWENPEFFSGSNNKDCQHYITKDYSQYGAEETFFLPIDIRYSWVMDINIDKDPELTDLSVYHLTRSFFPQNILNRIHSGQTKVLFICLTEGSLTRQVYDILKIFIQNNGLQQGEYYFLTSNLNPVSIPEEFRPYVKMVPYFFEDLWFKVGIGNNITGRQEIEKFIQDNMDRPKKYKFLQLSRHPRPFRSFMRGFMECFPEVRNNTLLSYAGGYTGEDAKLGHIVADLETYARPEGITKEVLDKLKLQDPNKSMTEVLDFDITLSDLSQPQTMILNRSLYCTSFCNILLETYAPYGKADSYFFREPIFFTEKTAKSLYACQPFLMINHTGSLRKLHELGFQTFGEWWDESYDDLEDTQDRLEAICKIILEINGWSEEKIHKTTQEMESVLRHNANRLLDIAYSKETFSFLEKVQKGGGGEISKSSRLKVTGGIRKLVKKVVITKKRYT